MSDEQIDRQSVAESIEPSESCLVVTRPQRRQAPGHDGGFDFRVEAAVMTFISDYYNPSNHEKR